MRVHSGAARLLLSALLAFSVAACGGKPKEKPVQRPTLTVTASTVTSVSLPRLVDASGTVQAWQEVPIDRKSTRLNSSHIPLSRMPSSA